MKNSSEITEFKEVTKISLDTIGKPTFIAGLYFAKMPSTMQDLLRTIVVGAANYKPETLGLRYIELPTKVAFLPVEELSQWHLKVKTRTLVTSITKEGDAITLKFKVDVKSEFYNQKDELEGTSEHCYFYEKVIYGNEVGIQYELMNSMRIG